MIFDESTAMLDPIGRKDVMATIRRLNREQGITVLTITHFMDEAVQADRVIVLDDGNVLLDGTPAEVFSRPEELAAAGLDVPQCTALMVALQKRGIPVEGDFTTPESCAQSIRDALARSGRKEA
jgi:energy-coupling factor transport system ATP-binding protein